MVKGDKKNLIKIKRIKRQDSVSLDVTQRFKIELY